MAIIKCKMCGGDLRIEEGSTVCECEYCGTRQTVPSADNEKKLTLFSRAGRLLRGCEFDKAAGVFETIVADFPEEAEAYWGLVLCKYGIEYVDDPTTGKKIPTCHRSSFDSVLDDPNYEQACENTDAVARRVYRDEARQIEDLRKRIIEVSGKEEPYDVFISYKETDEHGDRTLDSVIAQDIYTELTEKGYRVFFSRISLEDKLGTEYEPYIFAALNSAKVMLVVGTDYENFDAVWVKNEWSRFLKLIASGQKKTLIPVFKNMDAYDMPKEFAKLAAQDMGKVGAMQDLVRGVEKLIGKKTAPAPAQQPQQVIVQQSGGPNTAALLKRGQQALEDCNWDKAREFFDRVLDIDAENSDAFFGLFLAGAKCLNEENYLNKVCAKNSLTEMLKLSPATERIEKIVKQYTIKDYLTENELRALFQYDLDYPSIVKAKKTLAAEEKQVFEKDRNLARAISYSKNEEKTRALQFKARLYAELDAGIKKAREQEAEARTKKQEDYEIFLTRAENTAYELHCKAKEKQEADLQEEVEKKEKHYQALLNRFEKTDQKRAFKTLKDEFVACGDYKDALLMVQRCDQEMEALNKAEREEKEQQEKAQKVQSARKKRRAIAVLTALLMIVGAVTYKAVIIPYKQYKEAEELFQKKQYSEAILAYEALGGYKDSRQKIEKIQSMILAETYDRAEKYYKAGDYTHAAMIFGTLGDYKDARKRSFALWAGFSHRDTVVEGYGHTVAVLNDGSVISTKFSGEQKNYFGQDEVSDWKDLIAVSEGYYTTLGLCKDGTVLAVGINDNGQCDVSEWADIVEVSGGLFHSVGLRTDGTVIATKYKGAAKYNYNQCDVSDWKDVVAVSAGRAHTVALRTDGTVIATGDNEFGQCNVGDWKGIIAIAAGSTHTVGLRSDGSVVSTGENKLGQCKTALWTDIVAVSASRNHTVGLKSDGTVVATGQNNCNQCDVSDWKDIVGIYAGSFLTIGIRPDGTLVTAGEEAYSQYDVSDWTEIQLPRSAEAVHLINQNYVDGEAYFKSGDIAKAAIAFGKAGDYKDARERSFALWKQCAKEDTIAAGVCHTLGLTTDNTVISAGANGTEQMGADGNLIVKAFDGAGQCEVSDWTDIISVTAGNYYTLGLKSDGTVIGTGLNDDGQTSVSSWHDISAVAAGTHSVGLKSDGTVVAAGWNEYGQCEVSDWRDIVAVAAGNHTVGLKADGTVLSVGKNDVGQCEVSDWTDIVAISANTYHTVGLKSDGTVVSTKITNFREFGQHDVSDWEDIIAVSAGMFHTVGLKADGTVCATGSNIFGQCNVSDWQDIVAVSAGSKHTVGLKSDGTVVAVGLTDFGQCDVSDWRNIKLPELQCIALMPSEEILSRLYSSAEKYYETGDYAQAAITFGKAGDYRDAKERSFELWRKVLPTESYIYADNAYSIALTNDADALCTGDFNGLYKIDVSGWHDIVKLSGSNHQIAGLTNDGRVLAFGEYTSGVEAWKDIIDISVSAWHILGLKKDGTVVAIGCKDQDYGQCNVAEWKDVVSISSGARLSAGLKKDGTVVATGQGTSGVSGWNDIIAIDASQSVVMGLKSDGTVVCSPYEGDPEKDYGQFDVSGWQDIVAIERGYQNTVGLKSDGTVVVAGRNNYNQFEAAKWKDIVKICVQNVFIVGLQSDGKVVAVGNNGNGQCSVTDWTNVVDIAVGSWHSLGLKSDGTLIAAGSNNHKQCDVSDWTNIKLPESQRSATVVNNGDEYTTSTKLSSLSNAQVGDCILFGTYEQDNDASNGKELIEWIVLEKEAGRLLAISKYALDCQKYNNGSEDKPWATCTLRKWLNDTFLNVAFSTEEQGMIPTVIVSADKNQNQADSENAIQDKVFLLNSREATVYLLRVKELQKCMATAYAVAQGVAQGARSYDQYQVNEKDDFNWWLREDNSTITSVVICDGIYDYFDSIGIEAVRPALWIELPQ